MDYELSESMVVQAIHLSQGRERVHRIGARLDGLSNGPCCERGREENVNSGFPVCRL